MSKNRETALIADLAATQRYVVNLEGGAEALRLQLVQVSELLERVKAENARLKAVIEKIRTYEGLRPGATLWARDIIRCVLEGKDE